MSNAIEIKNLNKSYEKFSLNDINFTLPKGYIMGFIGENGAGKTTTIKSILGMTNYEAKHIHVLGGDLKTTPNIKEDIGVVMDLPFFVEDWKADNIQRVMGKFYSNWDNNRFTRLIKELDIPDKKVKELSRGNKTKLMLAAALSHRAKLLILDEATTGLDPAVKNNIMEILRQYMVDDNNSILMSSHITADLEKLADYITYIREGKIVFTGTKDELLGSYIVIKGGNNLNVGVEDNLMLGKRTTEYGFTALLKAEYKEKLAKDILIEPASLEDIMIFTSRRRNYGVY